jgi:hypothetical protein
MVQMENGYQSDRPERANEYGYNENIDSNSVAIVNGVSTAIVYFIAVTSFVIGMTLVAAIWYIHDAYGSIEFINFKPVF